MSPGIIGLVHSLHCHLGDDKADGAAAGGGSTGGCAATDLVNVPNAAALFATADAFAKSKGGSLLLRLLIFAAAFEAAVAAASASATVTAATSAEPSVSDLMSTSSSLWDPSVMSGSMLLQPLELGLLGTRGVFGILVRRTLSARAFFLFAFLDALFKALLSFFLAAIATSPAATSFAAA